ncbi:MAG: hypothetical protein EBZ47_09005 [Chlamydiae bacterium]|nr:hypothetical protein [Chlamydiota bacterium]
MCRDEDLMLVSEPEQHREIFSPIPVKVKPKKKRVIIESDDEEMNVSTTEAVELTRDMLPGLKRYNQVVDKMYDFYKDFPEGEGDEEDDDYVNSSENSDFSNESDDESENIEDSEAYESESNEQEHSESEETESDDDDMDSEDSDSKRVQSHSSSLLTHSMFKSAFKPVDKKVHHKNSKKFQLS